MKPTRSAMSRNLKIVVRISYFVSCLLIVAALMTQGAHGSPTLANDNPSQEHLSGLKAKVTLADGRIEIVRINGIGCTESMCSTVLTKAKTASGTLVEIWFDSIATIRDIHQNDALFISKDGSQRRLSFISDFRVLYASKNGGATEKIDLAKIKVLEFLGTDR